MSIWYEIVAGECIESVAHRYGFSPITLWEHPENAPLRSIRENSHVLSPGDRIFIPDKREGSEIAATAIRHIFRRKGVPAKLRLRLEVEGEPRAGIVYKITIDGHDAGGGVTDDDGRIDRWISPDAVEAKLSIGEHEVYHIRLGHLLPLSDPAGVRERLKNLGYNISTDDNENLRSAIHYFQLDEDLEPTGELDETTRARLGEVHGS